MEAAASGVVSNHANTSSGSAPRSSRSCGRRRIEGHGGHLAVQLLELGNPLGAEQVGPACEDLPKLHKRRAQLFERQPHLHGWLHAGQVGSVGPVQRLARALQPVGQAQAAHGVAKAVAHHHAQDFLQAPQVAGGVQRLDEHGAMIGSDAQGGLVHHQVEHHGHGHKGRVAQRLPPARIAPVQRGQHAIALRGLLPPCRACAAAATPRAASRPRPPGTARWTRPATACSRAGPPSAAMASPVAGWMSTVGVVNHQSARTTRRVTTACACTLPLRLVKNM